MFLSFKQYLTESFDSKPAAWKWTKKDVYAPKKILPTGGLGYFEDRLAYGVARFRIDSNEYEMQAGFNYNGYLEISFSLVRGDEHEDELTNTGNQFKVFATVIDFAKTIIREFNPPKVSLSATKSTSSESLKVSKARERVYLRLIERTIDQIEGRWHIHTSEDTVRDDDGKHTLAVFEIINLDHEYRLKEGSK